MLVACLASFVPWAEGMPVPTIINIETPDVLSRDAMFMGGATLLGLVAFGSLLNVLFVRNNKPSFGRPTAAMLAVGVISAVVSSWCLMFAAFYDSEFEAGVLISLIALLVGAFLVAVGFGNTLDEWFKRRGSGSSSNA